MAWTYIHAAFRVVVRPGLTPGQRLLLLHLANRVDNRGKLTAELVELQEWTCLSRRAVQLALRGLSQARLLTVERRHNKANRLSLPFDPYAAEVENLHPNSASGVDSAPLPGDVEFPPQGVENAPRGAMVAPAIKDPSLLLGRSPVSDEVAAQVVAVLLESSRDVDGVARFALGASPKSCLTAAKLALVRNALVRNPASLDEVARIGRLIAATELFAYLRAVPLATLFQTPSKHRQDNFEHALLQARSPIRLSRLKDPPPPPRPRTPTARKSRAVPTVTTPGEPTAPATPPPTVDERQLDLFGPVRPDATPSNP